MPKIKVHERALAHLSRGLYRSPASALRELVSNAWDANATEIRINTNYPFFYQMTIEDNGNGFSKTDFEKIMDGGIGNSEKRSDQKELINNRPIIGRLGIGMLGIAQICGAFTIFSKPISGEGFRARVTLYDLLKEKIDARDERILATEVVNVGEYKFEDYDQDTFGAGTTIIADDIHPTFIHSFQKSLKFEKFKEPPLNWDEAIDIVSGVRSLQELGDYWRLLWEMSASCPVQYVNENCLPYELIKEEQEKLRSFDFKVMVDGINLKKPIRLANNPGGYTYHKIDPQTIKVYGKNIRFHGYLIVQEGTQLRPDELRGILIRIKNVGIGYYDYSFLDYRYNEGPRSRWLTGEIIVDEGLEDALNIDRDSFNRFHPEFRAIQEEVHDLLHSKIFPVSYQKIDERSEEKATIRSENRKEYLKEIISGVLNSPVEIIQKNKEGTIETDIPEPKVGLSKRADLLSPEEQHFWKEGYVSVSKRENGVAIELPDPEIMKTKRTYKDLASSILAIYEVSMKQNNQEENRKTFTELLLKLLERW